MSMGITSQEKAWVSSHQPILQNKAAKSKKLRPSGSSKPTWIKLKTRSTNSKKRVFRYLIMIMNARKRTKSFNTTQSVDQSYFLSSKWGRQPENLSERTPIWTQCGKSYRILVKGTILTKTKITQLVNKIWGLGICNRLTLGNLLRRILFIRTSSIMRIQAR